MPSKSAIFFSRLGSSLVLWTLALFTIFRGWGIGVFVLISGVGLLALWEFYRMLGHKELPNFKVLAMICGLIFIIGSFYYFKKVGPAESYDYEVSVLLFFLLIVFARQMFER